MRELVDEGGEGFLQMEFDGVFVDRLNAVDVLVERVAGEVLVGIDDALEIRLDRSGVEGFAVAELDAFTELHGIDEAVVAHFIAFGEDVLKLHVLVEPEEAFIEGLGNVLRERVACIVGVERREGGINAHGDFGG